jgi:acyl carrier protein phosphodiesterase
MKRFVLASGTMEAMRQSWSDDRLDHLNRRVDEGFALVDQRFDQVDQRFERLEDRFDHLDERFDRLLHALMVAALSLIGSVIVAIVGGGFALLLAYY